MSGKSIRSADAVAQSGAELVLRCGGVGRMDIVVGGSRPWLISAWRTDLEVRAKQLTSIHAWSASGVTRFPELLRSQLAG